VSDKSEKKKKSRMQKKYIQIRAEHWPKLEVANLWDRTECDGFTTMPRTMPHIGRILDALADSGKPLAETYFALWARVWDEAILIIDTPKALAFESGFLSSRGESNWRERMKKLKELGFIDSKPGTSGEFHYVLLYNPHKVVRRLRADNRIDDRLYNPLYERALDVGADDFTARETE
jgi:hypothetical protein